MAEQPNGQDPNTINVPNVSAADGTPTVRRDLGHDSLSAPQFVQDTDMSKVKLGTPDSLRDMTTPVERAPKKKNGKFIALGTGVVGLITAGVVALGATGGSSNNSEHPAPSETTSASASPSATTSIEATPTPTPTEAVKGIYGYDPMTFEGYSETNPATPADFQPIPHNATPAEILKDYGDALNKVIASNDGTLWDKVRGVYTDSLPIKTGEGYGDDLYINSNFGSNNGAANEQLGTGPTIVHYNVSKEAQPKYLTGAHGEQILVIEADTYQEGYDQTADTYRKFGEAKTTGVFVYKNDLTSPSGAKESGWVLVDGTNYGLLPN